MAKKSVAVKKRATNKKAKTKKEKRVVGNEPQVESDSPKPELTPDEVIETISTPILLKIVLERVKRIQATASSASKQSATTAYTYLQYASQALTIACAGRSDL